MTENNDEITRANRRTWYDDLTAWAAICMILVGIGAIGYGAATSVIDSVKKHRANNVTRQTQSKSNTVPIDTVPCKPFGYSR